MKSVNILSVIDAYRNLNSELFQKLMNSYGILVGNHKGIKDHELDGIEALVKNINNTDGKVSFFDKYYMGYSIPQIAKEFDLLRFGNNFILNIEIKSESTLEKIQKQQERNRYYLSFLGKDIHIYTFVLSSNKLYELIVGDSRNIIREVSFTDLCRKLSKQEIAEIDNIDRVFNPSNYLVSPFNSTEKFMTANYFLTRQQEEIYKKIQRQLLDNSINFIALTGGAGTGKTLLTYHIAKEAIDNGIKVLILHCAQLNEGHRELNEKWKWNICMPKYALDNIDEYDLIIIDEAQRMYPPQFEQIKSKIPNSSKKCIFSYDEKQYLSPEEEKNKISRRINDELSCTIHTLNGKIRINNEISSFIKQLFDLNRKIPNKTYPDIELIYSYDYSSAKELLQNLLDSGWKVPNYTPGKKAPFHYEIYNSGDPDCAHSVIGQEYDNIVVVIDSTFKYNRLGQLIASNTYYSQRQMLYQIITRTRKKLCVVVINNEMILNRCIDILSQ